MSLLRRKGPWIWRRAKNSYSDFKERIQSIRPCLNLMSFCSILRQGVSLFHCSALLMVELFLASPSLVFCTMIPPLAACCTRCLKGAQVPSLIVIGSSSLFVAAHLVSLQIKHPRKIIVSIQPYLNLTRRNINGTIQLKSMVVALLG